MKTFLILITTIFNSCVNHTLSDKFKDVKDINESLELKTVWK